MPRPVSTNRLPAKRSSGAATLGTVRVGLSRKRFATMSATTWAEARRAAAVEHDALTREPGAGTITTDGFPAACGWPGSAGHTHRGARATINPMARGCWRRCSNRLRNARVDSSRPSCYSRAAQCAPGRGRQPTVPLAPTAGFRPRLGHGTRIRGISRRMPFHC